ncbi:hypothetical protein ABB37_06965 [Leptomonas pyrrhocoris]|uniref:Uncharacterized protein n=1 Tax=Leptomonas pyrrhocoris TaxID=157538 RepID=A0A0M9FWV0_LEPPY|nr:hypothetical protein ABB37_06965 [Leptomonas pyrrhocoris]KPA77599.1 hypothetical protein ABB37_06965 [Leptomonas pyrrhocoris]|eukprot:XP_015656038.1 hypothetical protein ABB37_06965 [Leptomonas pyrrhocoris]
MRDAADWSAAVQRERAEKRQRALSLHEAAKAEEQHRREVAEAQSKRELQRRKEERQQMRKALKEDDEMTDFQDRSTQFLKNQQRLINLGASVAYAEQQHKARAKEDMHKTWTKSLTGASAGAAAMTMTMTMGNSTTGYPLSSVPVSSRAAGPPAARTAAALSKESELRQAALYTEDAYVQLSLAYRNEAHRSRATAGILAAPAANSAVASSTAGSAPAVTACGPGPASVAPLPFRTAPQMYCHDSADHMGSFAHDIPTTYIPEYFEDRYGATGAVSASGAANGFGEEVMPLPLTPAPVSQEASNALRHSYYPWAALADAGTDNAKPVLPSREAYFPVERWGAAELQASIYGHNVHPNGTMQESCERRREFAEDFNYTTIPCDNATATSNSPEKIEPYHSGKRIDVWL